MTDLEDAELFGGRKRAADKYARALEEAKPGELQSLVESSCIHCNRQIGRDEIKILPPMYMQERDPYVTKGVVRRRYMCLQCYGQVRSLSKRKALPNDVRKARLSKLKLIDGEMEINKE